jgi:hypothetical protein
MADDRDDILVTSEPVTLISVHTRLVKVEASVPLKLKGIEGRLARIEKMLYVAGGIIVSLNVDFIKSAIAAMIHH